MDRHDQCILISKLTVNVNDTIFSDLMISMPRFSTLFMRYSSEKRWSRDVYTLGENYPNFSPRKSRQQSARTHHISLPWALTGHSPPANLILFHHSSLPQSDGILVIFIPSQVHIPMYSCSIMRLCKLTRLSSRVCRALRNLLSVVEKAGHFACRMQVVCRDEACLRRGGEYRLRATCSNQ
jgi:hypothetical protein